MRQGPMSQLFCDLCESGRDECDSVSSFVMGTMPRDANRPVLDRDGCASLAGRLVATLLPGNAKGMISRGRSGCDCH
jgi:hypothetical protein